MDADAMTGIALCGLEDWGLELRCQLGILGFVICLGISEALQRYLTASGLPSKVVPGPRYISSPKYP